MPGIAIDRSLARGIANAQTASGTQIVFPVIGSTRQGAIYIPQPIGADCPRRTT